jgi:hypothetical protein
MRAFSVTVPDDANFHNLFSLIVGTAIYGLANGGTNETGITGAVPTNGILSNLVSLLVLSVPSGNTENKLLSDRNYANSSITVFKSGATGQLTIGPMSKNSINLMDYFVANSSAASNETLGVLIEVS